MNRREELEEKLEYCFHDRTLLLTALTHTSYANEHKKANCPDNERLEFLGDAVLEVVSSEFLYQGHPEMGEGELSKTRASMVCEPSLAKCARDLGLPNYLRLGKGEEQMGGRTKDSIISDAVEAVIGAIFLDGGFEEAKRFVMTHVLLDLRSEDLFTDKKTRLQEILQDQGMQVEYRLLKTDGPDHMRTFTIGAIVDGTLMGRGTGRTKKAAAQEAARQTLEKINAQGTHFNVSEID